MAPRLSQLICNALEGASRVGRAAAPPCGGGWPRRRGGRAEPSAAEHGRLARVFRDATCYRATTRRTLAFFLFFAPPRRDRPRFARVNARHPRPTGDGASARLPPIVKAPKTEALHPPRAHHARTHTYARAYTHTQTRVVYGVLVPLLFDRRGGMECVQCARFKSSRAVTSAPHAAR